MKIDLQTIIAASKNLGLDFVSHSKADFLQSEYERLESWQTKGFAGEMGFMQRSPDLLCNPKAIFDKANSILVFALYYDRGPMPPFERGYGKVARYAWGKDYHKVIKKKLKQLLAVLQEKCGEQIEFRYFSDAVPLLERAIAKNAGLGFVGKNSLLIRPKSGSYFFIAEILSNLEISENKLALLDEDCGSCNNCISNCPTQAIVGERVIDAKRCISYLTIEKKGILNEWEREALGEWIFGCDVCQEVCPFNHQSLKKEEPPQLEEFSKSAGVGPLLRLSEILSIRTHEEYVGRFAGTALMRAGRESLVRNAALVAANTAAETAAEALRQALYEDSSEVVRSSAFWSLSKLNHKCNIFTKQQMDSFANKAYSDTLSIKQELQIL